MKNNNQNIKDIISNFLEKNKECYAPISRTHILNLSKKLNILFPELYITYMSSFGNDSSPFYSRDLHFYPVSRLEELNLTFRENVDDLKNEENIKFHFDVENIFTFAARFDGNDIFWFWNLNDEDIENPSIFSIDTTYYEGVEAELKHTFWEHGKMDAFIETQFKKYEYEKWRINYKKKKR